MPQSNIFSKYGIPNGNLRELPSWEIDPSDPKAIREYKEALVRHFTHEYMDELGVTHEQAISDEFQDVDRDRLIAEGMARAFPVAMSREEMQGRAVISLGLDAYQANLHKYDVEKEPETFLDWMLVRFGKLKSAGALSEMRFMFELYDTFDKRGNRNFIEELFADRDNFARFTKAISPIRQRRDELVSFESHMQEVEQKMDRAIRIAKDDERKQELVTQKDELLSKMAVTRQELEGDLEDTLVKAVQLSRNPNISAEEIVPLINGHLHLNEDGSIKQIKLPVQKLLLDNSVVYIIAVKPEGASTVERAISDFAEVQVTDVYVALDAFEPYLRKGDQP